MPVPKRKTGKTRKQMRRSHHAPTPTGLGICQNCGERTIPHRVCKQCGYYNTRTAINVDDD